MHGVPAVGEHQAARRAHPDQLVVEHVRRHPDQLQLPAPGTEQLVPGGERDQVGEPFQRHAVAIGHEFPNGLGQLDGFSHDVRYADT